jgi:lipoprotein-anchoring transpeptidase ErfK/SrfK
VTGRWTKVERVRAGRPTAWKVRYPSAGLAVEIDITRQVLVVSRAGVVQRVLDVSSGSESVYYQRGARNIAHTPRGHYAIGRRINGLHKSDLGLLYRPVFFYQGYAIHGSDSVPAFPASHGCVRITNPAMDRLYGVLVSGVPVSVYDE